MKYTNSDSGDCTPSVWNLRSRENRIRLRKAGYTEKEIEELFVRLEGLEIVPVNWHEAATKLSGGVLTYQFQPDAAVSVHAAGAGVSA